MIRLRAECDGCGYVHDTDTYPATWPVMRPTEAAEEQHYCSQACLIKYLGGDDSTLRQQFRLSVRDIEILRLASMGRTTLAIAQELHLHRQTVKNNLLLIYATLHVHDRVQAVLVAYALGLLNLNTSTQEVLSEWRERAIKQSNTSVATSLWSEHQLSRLKRRPDSAT